MSTQSNGYSEIPTQRLLLALFAMFVLIATLVLAFIKAFSNWNIFPLPLYYLGMYCLSATITLSYLRFYYPQLTFNHPALKNWFLIYAGSVGVVFVGLFLIWK